MRTHKQLDELFSLKSEIMVERSMAERAILHYTDRKKDAVTDRNLFIDKMKLLRKGELLETELRADDYGNKIKHLEELLNNHTARLQAKMNAEQDVTTQIINLQELIKKYQNKILKDCATIESQLEMLNNNLDKLIAIPLPASSTARLRDLALDPNTYRSSPSISKPIRQTQQVKVGPILRVKAFSELPPSTMTTVPELD